MASSLIDSPSSTVESPAPVREKRGRKRRRSEETRPHPAASKPSESKPTDIQAIYDSFNPGRLNRRNVDWIVLFWMTGIHVGALAAPFFFSWSALGVAVFLHWLTASIGITMTYHRYLSHRSFKLKPPAEFVAMLCAALAGEGSPLSWSATHRLHHSRSDKEGDPHSPLIGAWWSHLLWLFVKRTPEQQQALYRRFTPELLDRPMVRFFEKTYFLWLVLSGVALFALGGLPWLVWGLCVRMVFAYHSTWFVNSATHLWGYRNYETRDESRNLWWVALASYGEGWHNNHHAHPGSARAGHRWWEIDMTYWAIATLKAVGLATDVKNRIPTPTTKLADTEYC